MRRRFLLPTLLPLLLLLAACSDDDATTRGSNTPAASGTDIASPAARQVRGRVVIDFKGSPGERAAFSASFVVEPGTKAWDAIRQAVGEGNLSFQDFGGPLGIFITGFLGVKAEGDHFWEFVVNGKASDVGVSTYAVKDGDVLEFRYS